MKADSKPQTILLVEDAEEDVFFFKMALRKCGIAAELIVVGDGERAWQLLKDPNAQQRFDIVFLDLKLPLMTGFEVLERLRDEEIFLDCRLVVLSGSCEEIDKRKAMALGVLDYLEKPITSNVLGKYLPCPATA